MRASISAEGGSAGGWGSETNVPPPRPRVANTWPLWLSAVSAWRSVERAIPSRAHSSRSAGSCEPGGSRPSLIAVPSRSTVSSNAVWERTAREHRLGRRERAGDGGRGAQPRSPSLLRCTRSQPLEPPEALPVGHRRAERRRARRRRR